MFSSGGVRMSRVRLSGRPILAGLTARRKAAFATEPTDQNQVWQLDFTEFETTVGGTWRLACCRDHWSKYELG
jgi:hypothetical protein